MSSAYIRVKEVRGQVPGTICNGVRTNSAINNTGPELHKSARGSGAVLGTEPKPRGNRSPEVPHEHVEVRARRHSLAPQLVTNR